MDEVEMKSVLFSLVAVGAVLLAFACAPAEVQYEAEYAHNAAPPGTGAYQPPWEHVDVMALEEAGMSINLGDSPPQLEGVYLTDSTEIYYDELDHVRDIADDYVFEFFSQSDDGIVRVSYSSEVAGDSASGLVGELTGDGDRFSIFVMNVQGNYDGCQYQTIFVYSGFVDGEGILDWQNGVIMASKEGDTCDALMDEGHRRIIHESDGLASTVLPQG